MNTVVDYTGLSKKITQGEASKHLPQKEYTISSVILYGSSSQPETRHQKSDIDLMVVLDIEGMHNDDFKFCFITQTDVNGVNVIVDIKYYTKESLQKELFKGSFTRLFALLNAYAIHYDENNIAENIISKSWERMDLIIKKTTQDFSLMNIQKEILDMQWYFTNVYSSLKSSKLKGNHFAISVSLFHECKFWLVQFHKVLFAKELENNEKVNRTYLTNLIMLNQHDGSRLLNYTKYDLDPRITKIIIELNHILEENTKKRNTVEKVFDVLNTAFKFYLDKPLLLNQSSHLPYYSFQ